MSFDRSLWSVRSFCHWRKKEKEKKKKKNRYRTIEIKWIAGIFTPSQLALGIIQEDLLLTLPLPLSLLVMRAISKVHKRPLCWVPFFFFFFNFYTKKSDMEMEPPVLYDAVNSRNRFSFYGQRWREQTFIFIVRAIFFYFYFNVNGYFFNYAVVGVKSLIKTVIYAHSTIFFLPSHHFSISNESCRLPISYLLCQILMML